MSSGVELLRTKDLDEVLGSLEERDRVDTGVRDGHVDKRLQVSSLVHSQLVEVCTCTHLGDGLEELRLGHGG